MTGLPRRGILVLILLLAGRAAAQRFPAFDPERIFAFGDTDLDGRLSLEEYREQLRASPRMKNAAATIEPLFRRLDSDRDGFLSLPEYRLAFPRRPGGPATKPGTSKEKRLDADAPRADLSPKRPITLEEERFFEAKIRPVLRRNAASAMRARPRNSGAAFASTAGRASARAATRARRSCPATPTRAC